MQFSQPPPTMLPFSASAPASSNNSTFYAHPSVAPQLPGYFTSTSPAGVAGSGLVQPGLSQPGVAGSGLFQPGVGQQQVPSPYPRFFLSNNEKCYVEYKNYVYYFHSHLEHAKPIILTKKAAQKLVDHIKQLEPFVVQQKRNIENDLTFNAELLLSGKDPLPPKDLTFYQVSLSTFKHFDIRLEANVYNNNIYIWLRLYVQDKDDPTIYRPCKGGILFGEDQYLNFEKFYNVRK
jgi:hypothetical protein